MKTIELAGRIAVVTFSRVLLNTSRRFVYTFAPTLSRAYHVPLTAITSLIAINQGTSLMGIFFAPLGDRFGYRSVMLWAMALLTAGMLAAGVLPVFGTLVVALLLAGLSKSLFDPAIQAYVAVRVPYQRRGLVIGILELAWAGSTILGIPLAGLMMAGYGLPVTFLSFAAVSLLSFVLIRTLIPADPPASVSPIRWQQTLMLLKTLRHNRSAIGLMGFSFCAAAANDNLFVVYAAWLEQDFGLGLVALGLGTSVIGAAEISGELLTAGLADRIGLKRSVIIGLLTSAAAYLLLPLAVNSLFSALVGLFLVFLTFEFMIVTSISLCTELIPEARATMMAAFYSTAGIGRVAGSIMGGRLWLAGGLPVVGPVSAALNILGLACLIWGLHHWQQH
jgi:MFS transporter, DHA1 family, inner membrane transport protein